MSLGWNGGLRRQNSDADALRNVSLPVLESWLKKAHANGGVVKPDGKGWQRSFTEEQIAVELTRRHKAK